jgi:hypothetical protein
MTDTTARSIAKTVSWRVCGSSAVFCTRKNLELDSTGAE